MANEYELNRAVQKATREEKNAEAKMIAAEKVVVETTAAANKLKEEYAKAAKEIRDEIEKQVLADHRLDKLVREKDRAEVAKVAAEVEAKRVIAEDIKRANATKRAADRDLKDYKETRSSHGKVQ